MERSVVTHDEGFNSSLTKMLGEQTNNRVESE